MAKKTLKERLVSWRAAAVAATATAGMMGGGFAVQESLPFQFNGQTTLEEISIDSRLADPMTTAPERVVLDSERAVAHTDHLTALNSFESRIDRLALQEETNWISRNIQEEAILADLRLSEHLTERDYTRLVDRFQQSAGTPDIPVGNYRQGARLQQECRVLTGFSFIDYDTSAERAEVVGDCMARGDTVMTNLEVGGALGGFFLGSLVGGFVPLGGRRRKKVDISNG